MVNRFLVIAGLIGLAMSALAAAPAHAGWYEASSDHFVIYADDSEKDIRRFAENLERFHSALEALTGWRVDKPSPSNRVVIFVVGSQRQVSRLAGGSRVAGFYVPRAGASRAFVQDIRNKSGVSDFSTIVLLHEYTHHFLISGSRFAMPRWQSEGMAEFFAAASFEKDGGVLIGRVARHRAGELAYARDVSVKELFDHELFQKRHGNRSNAFYGRSWLLYHYLTFEPSRRGQIDQYTRAMIEGSSSTAAAERAFGDLGQLQSDLNRYMRGRRFMMLTMTPEQLPIGKVSLRRLSEGEAEIMPLRIRSQRGVNDEQAAKIVPEARKVAQEFPDDAAVFAALAEAEFDAGNDDAAIAAADRAIALNPKLTNPYVQKGFALFRKARDAEDEEAAYQAAMKPFSQLNAIEADHPIPLIYYYRSYAERGIEPPENAKAAIEWAAQLAPFDKALWFNVANMQMQDGKIGLAKLSLKPLANDPHGGRRADTAKALIALLDRTDEGTQISGRDIALAMPVRTEQVPSSAESEEDAEGSEDEPN